MDDVSRRVISRLAGRHAVKTLRGRLSRLGLNRRRALTAAPALLVVPLMAGVSGSAVSPQAGAAGPAGGPRRQLGAVRAGHRHLRGVG